MPNKYLFKVALLAISVIIFVALSLIYSLRTSPVETFSQPFPTFQLPNLKQLSSDITEKDLTGKVHLVNIWGSWCPMCIAEHDFLMALSSQGVPIVGISYKDEAVNSLAFLRRRGDPYVWTVLDLQGHFQAPLQIKGVPISYLVDQDGRIRLKYTGILSPSVWESAFVPLMKQLQNDIQ